MFVEVIVTEVLAVCPRLSVATRVMTCVAWSGSNGSLALKLVPLPRFTEQPHPPVASL